MSKQYEKVSKFLSYVLRHQPEAIGLTLDSEGWADIDELIELANQNGRRLNSELIKAVVEINDKQRFTLSEDGLRIRAAQGHSTKQVDLSYQKQIPPLRLYHGTTTRFIDSIKEKGLIAGSLHYVHLSADEQTAIAVGKRHGKPIVLKINALLMHEQGFNFYLADNGVWLTESVPVEFIDFFQGDESYGD